MNISQAEKTISCSLVRKIKIHKLIPVLSKKELEIINFTKNILSNLILFKCDRYYNHIFYMNKKGEFVIEFNTSDNTLYVSYERLWKDIEDNFPIFITHNEIQIFLHYLMEKIFKQKLPILGIDLGIYSAEMNMTFLEKFITIPTQYHYKIPTYNINIHDEVEKLFKKEFKHELRINKIKKVLITAE